MRQLFNIYSSNRRKLEVTKRIKLFLKIKSNIGYKFSCCKAIGKRTQKFEAAFHTLHTDPGKRH